MANKGSGAAVKGALSDEDKDDGRGGWYHAFLLPVTVVALHLAPEEAVLTEEAQERIEKLIVEDLRRVGHAEVTGALVGERLYELQEIEEDGSDFDESSIWPTYADDED